MKLVRTSKQLVRLLRHDHARGRSIGFVPTMGALHEGHLSLIRAAARHTRIVVVSIFVNPLQFGPREDYRRYPRPLSRDARLAREAGCHVLFVPSVRELYPTGFCTFVSVEGISDRLEGLVRPGHFRGVATVVATLFGLVQPDIAYFGQKDFQQCLVIQRMVEDLRVPVRVRVLPTVRESDGLAMSSRNAYLSPDARRRATIFFQALCDGRAAIRVGERRPAAVVRRIQRRIARDSSVTVEYLAAVNARTAEPLSRLRRRVALVGAIRIASTRLIDNLLVDVS